MTILSLMRPFRSDLVIDLGTENTLFAFPGQSDVWSEPSVLALQRSPDAEPRALAAGLAALEMEGKAPASIQVIRPLSNGIIVDATSALLMLQLMLRKLRPSLAYRTILISSPFATTAIEARAFLELAWALEPYRALLVAEPLAAAVGADLPLLRNNGQMLVDLGKGIIEAVITSQGHIVASAATRLGGRSDNERLMHHLRDHHGLIIGPQMAERTKRCLASGFQHEFLTLSGHSLAMRLPSRIRVRAGELREVLEPCTHQILACITEAMEQAPVELVTDIMEQGLTLTGGGALQYGLAERLATRLKVPVRVARSPLHAVAVGNRRILESKTLRSILAS